MPDLRKSIVSGRSKVNNLQLDYTRPMKPWKRGFAGIILAATITVLVASLNCRPSPRNGLDRSVLIAEKSRDALFLDKGETFTAPWDAVLIQRGWFIELYRLEQAVNDGSLVPREAQL
jgi:hypothetical protein